MELLNLRQKLLASGIAVDTVYDLPSVSAKRHDTIVVTRRVLLSRIWPFSMSIVTPAVTIIWSIGRTTQPMNRFVFELMKTAKQRLISAYSRHKSFNAIAPTIPARLSSIRIPEACYQVPTATPNHRCNNRPWVHRGHWRWKMLHHSHHSTRIMRLSVSEHNWIFTFTSPKRRSNRYQERKLKFK